MRILSRYIISEFLKVFFICLTGFILVFLLVEITDKLKYYFEYNPTGGLMLKYFLVKIPGYLFFAMPLSILLGGMLSLLIMAKNSELIAMQANGIDALAIARPVLLVGLVASGLMLVANETIIPWSNRYAEYIQNVEIAHKPDTTYVKHNEIWMRSPDSLTHIKRFDKPRLALKGVTVIKFNRDYQFVERIFADQGKWWRDHWVLYGVNRTVRTSDDHFQVEAFPTMTAPFDKRPSDFEKVESSAKDMNLHQLGRYIRQMEDEGQTPTRPLVDWHDKLAFPFVCLIMACLSVPFAAKLNPRSGGVAVGMAVSLVIAFSYWIIHTFFIALGHGGYIPPIAAAWASNVIFGFAAVWLLLRAGT